MKFCRLLVLLLAAAWPPNASRADDISLVLTRLGIADAAWQRDAKGLAERAFAQPRNHSATGMLLRYMLPAKFGVSAGFETGTLGDRAKVAAGTNTDKQRLGGLEAAWSAALLGAAVDYRYLHRGSGIYGGGQLALDTLFSDLELAGLAKRETRARNIALTSLRMQAGWDATTAGKGAENRALTPWLGLQFGWTEVKPIAYDDWGSLNVGGWNGGLEFGLRFGGLNRLWDETARYRPRQKAAVNESPAPTNEAPPTAP
jgi:hypothetical protein